jgi:hypothetical protein
MTRHHYYYYNRPYYYDDRPYYDGPTYGATPYVSDDRIYRHEYNMIHTALAAIAAGAVLIFIFLMVYRYF